MARQNTVAPKKLTKASAPSSKATDVSRRLEAFVAQPHLTYELEPSEIPDYLEATNELLTRVTELRDNLARRVPSTTGFLLPERQPRRERVVAGKNVMLLGPVRRTAVNVRGRRSRSSACYHFCMAASKRISSARVRAVAIELHRKAALQPRGSSRVRITSGETATGKGIIRFRAARMLEAYRSKMSAGARKTSPSKTRASR